jgi:hypothetical protein
MKKVYTIPALVLLLTFTLTLNIPKRLFIATDIAANPGLNDEEEQSGYDGKRQRDSLEFEKTKDPSLGYVPVNRLETAIKFTENLKRFHRNDVNVLSWTARGPIFDSLGPSNGNLRGGFSYTSGYMSAVLVDTLHDPSGNTVLIGGTTGGVWKTTNFLSPFPNWTAVNDSYETLSVTYFCQDPTNANTMYYTTGDGFYGATTVYGGGIWKSVDAGNNWIKLPTTANFYRSFKIICDAAGNVYAGLRSTTVPVVQRFGLWRSKDHGTNWENITPATVGSSDSSCTDIEISSTGRLHASFGYQGTIVKHWYTDDPVNVTASTGWNASTGIRSSGTATSCIRMELACLANTLYAITINTNENIDSCYKSIDGGATWAKQNTSPFSSSILNGQGDYDVTLAINPVNTSQIIVGGLDAYKSYNSGQSFDKHLSFWITDTITNPYVHADHHFMQWWMVGAESRVVIGGDGGIFISRDSGNSWADRNRNLNLKQFYSGDLHPDRGSPYIIGGAQDNGTHQLKTPGLSYSYEVKGGDGCNVHINQANPLIQWGSYVFNQYRRSVDGGLTWNNGNISTGGLFVNPYDYDDGQNILYACNGSNAIWRWTDANITSAGTAVAITSAAFAGTPSAFKVSPYTPNTVFIGTNSGRMYKLSNANTVTSATIGANLTDLTGSGFTPSTFLHSINIGSSEQFLVAVFSNFGINNVWYSNDGGTSWSAIDGNLPDMPVRSALFDPSHDDQLYIATAAGVFHTTAVNGSSTVWMPETGIPTVRTDMLKIRLSDNTLLAATYGRGMYTAIVAAPPEVRFSASAQTVTESTSDSIGCRYYKDYSFNVSMLAAPTGDATVTYSINGGNTASEGTDFDYTTNGNFASISHQHIFQSGVAQTKFITIRVYDDAMIEPTESFGISFVVSGTTDARAGAAKNFAFTIRDNDRAPTGSAVLSRYIGNNNVSLTQPFRSEFSDARTQIVYLASELTAAGLNAGSVTSIAFDVVAKVTSTPFNSLTVKLKNTATSTLTGGDFETGATTVAGPMDYNTIVGTNVINLTSSFIWDGTSNILVDICYDNVSPSSGSGSNDLVKGTNGGDGCHFTRQNVTPGCSLVSALNIFAGAGKPDITFTISSTGGPIASALNVARTERLAPNQDLYYYAPGGQILARIQSLSGFDYGCTSVTIDRAGTGATAFWNNDLSNKLLDKTFHIAPVTNNSTGTYQLTLYYSQAEKEGWEAATGQSWNNIQLVKVAGHISQVTPASPGGGGNVETVTPTRATLGNNYTLTYTFNSGFSGFGAGVAGVALPVQLTDFTARLHNNSVELNWKTVFENNAKGFEIERSYDGQSFNRIGFVPAKGFSNVEVNYHLTDKSISQENNYYRLKQIDLNNRYEYSKVILLKNPLSAKKPFNVIRNPFASSIDIQFAEIPRGSVRITLFDGAGKLVGTWNLNSVTYNRVRLDANGPLSAGIYMLHVKTINKEFIEKLLKE